MRRLTRTWLLGGALLTALILSGCGANSPSGNGAVSQPQISPSTGNNTPTSSMGQPGDNSLPADANAQSPSTSTQNPGSSQSQPANTKTITIHVGGNEGLTLVPVSVNVNGTGTSFVPVSRSVQAVLLPSGWQLQSNSYGSTGTTMKWINTKDSSQYISEVIQSFSRNLNQFYASQGRAASWLVPNQVVEFRLTNPNNPNPDIGLIANTSNGGSIRLDVYLPSDESSQAIQIVKSFVGSKS